MSTYKYTFTKGKEVIESTGYNLFNGAENAGIRITCANRLNRWYISKTPFEKRERTIAGIKEGEMYSSNYKVTQKYNRITFKEVAALGG